MSHPVGTVACVGEHLPPVQEPSVTATTPTSAASNDLLARSLTSNTVKDATADEGQSESSEATGREPFDGLLSVMAFATAPNAELYVSVMEAAVEARGRFRLQLRPADIVAATGIDRDTASSALEYLADHKALHKTYDASEAETLAEYYKGAFLYQVTPAGMAAHIGVRAVLDTRMAVAGRLSASLLPRIHEQLEALGRDADDHDDSRLAADFAGLFALVDELADSAATYLRELDAEVSDLATDAERLAAYKAAVLTYLERFNRELNTWTPRIVAAIEGLASDAPVLLARAAKVDAAPRPDGTIDDGPIDRLTGQWDGTVGWFAQRPGRQPTVDYVGAAMIAAINRVLSAIARVHDRRIRQVSREADFGQLAAWFAVSSPTAAHTLWDAATGLWAARHFHDLAGDESLDRRKSFWTAGQAELPPRVRSATRRGSTGRPGKRADYSTVKRAARDRAREAAAQAAAARTRLAARTPARLSDLAELDGTEFTAFLEVIGAALAEYADNGARTAVLPGTTIRLRPAADGRTGRVVTPHGIFFGPDDTLEIDVAGTQRSQAAVS
jgi:uncharacterized protein (TIGR02677 family)